MKEPFVFEYYVPSLDWYDIEEVVVNWGEYSSFHLELRFGFSWWLIGRKFNEDDFSHSCVTLGRVSRSDILRLIEWCKLEYGGSLLTGVVSISPSLNVSVEFSKLELF